MHASADTTLPGLHARAARSLAFLVLLALAAAAVGCGSDGATGPGGRTARLGTYAYSLVVTPPAGPSRAVTGRVVLAERDARGAYGTWYVPGFARGSALVPNSDEPGEHILQALAFGLVIRPAAVRLSPEEQATEVLHIVRVRDPDELSCEAVDLFDFGFRDQTGTVAGPCTLTWLGPATERVLTPAGAWHWDAPGIDFVLRVVLSEVGGVVGGSATLIPQADEALDWRSGPIQGTYTAPRVAFTITPPEDPSKALSFEGVLALDDRSREVMTGTISGRGIRTQPVQLFVR